MRFRMLFVLVDVEMFALLKFDSINNASVLGDSKALCPIVVVTMSLFIHKCFILFQLTRVLLWRIKSPTRIPVRLSLTVSFHG